MDYFITWMISLVVVASAFEINGSSFSSHATINLAVPMGMPFKIRTDHEKKIVSNLPSWITMTTTSHDSLITGLPLAGDLDNKNVASGLMVCQEPGRLHCQLYQLSPQTQDDVFRLQAPTSCPSHRPVVAIVQLGVYNIQSLLATAQSRLNLWATLRRHLMQLPHTAVNSQQTFLISLREPEIVGNLSVLAKAMKSRNQTTPLSSPLFIIWRIGCDFLDAPAIELLSRIEYRYEHSVTVSDWLDGYEGHISKWMVGELLPGLQKRPKRQAYQSYQPIYPSRNNYESSGLYPVDFWGPQTPLQPHPNGIDQIEIPTQQISTVPIPHNTFLGVAAAGIRPKLLLFEHMYPLEFGLDFNDPSQLTGNEIGNDESRWISFDPTLEVIRFHPNTEHKGNHKLILCAYYPASDNRECRNAPFAWDTTAGELCVLTHLKSEQIMAFNFSGISKLSADRVDVEFRLAVKVPPPLKLISGPRLRFRLIWSDAHTDYQLKELPRLSAGIAQALRIRINPSVNPPNIFIYDVIHIRNFQEKDKSATTKLLEIEFIYLPLGLPDSSFSLYWKILDELANEVGDGVPQSISSTSAYNRQQFNQLRSICQAARLDGAVGALEASADLFRPFHLERIEADDLHGGACPLTLGRDPLVNGLETSTEASASAEARIHIRTPVTTTNVPFSDQVIENFTVEAGLAFKKRITPSKVVQVSRIRAIDILDETNNRLNDTAWITVAEDSTNLYGVPLQKHARDEAYRFWLSIHTVDQRTPVNIFFTVDVVKWPWKLVHSASPRVHEPPERRAVQNHRVRMQISFADAAGVVPTPPLWPPSAPEVSLAYRWGLVTNTDKYLRPNCGLHCGVGIMLLDIQRRGPSMIQVDWALLPLLNEGLQSQFPAVLNTSTTSSVCPQRSIQDLQRRLLKNPVNPRYTSSSVTSPHKEFFPENELRHASWSQPTTQLVEHIEWARLGTVSDIAMDLIGSCFYPYWKFDATRGGLGVEGAADFLPLVNFTTYIGETFRHPIVTDSARFQSLSLAVRLFDKDLVEVNASSWIGVDVTKYAVIGIAMKSEVSAGIHEFRVMTSSVGTMLSRLLVKVLEKNPQLPEVPNHRVLMRFEPEYAVRADLRTHMLQTLSRKWLFLVALDEFLRPECHQKAKYSCIENMNILVINIASDGELLNVIWAMKSLVYLPMPADPAKRSTASVELDHATPPRNQRLQQMGGPKYGEIPAPPSGSVIADQELSCPWSELGLLASRLQPGVGATTGITKWLAQAGFGRLLDVKIERLGPCSGPQLSGSKTPLSTKPLSHGAPLSNPFNNLNTDLHNLFTTKRPIKHHPLPYEPATNIFQHSTTMSPWTPTSSNTQQQQRTFLLTTLLPICGVIVVLLAISLVLIWFLKFRGNRKTAGNGGDNDGEEFTEPERLRLKEDLTSGRKNGMPIIKNCGNLNSNNSKLTRKPGSANNGDNGLSSPPSKPLILANEKPPLNPPDIVSPPPPPKTQLEQESSNFPRPRGVPPGALPNVRHLYAMGPRPDPYRNLPPPIDARFGMPRQMTPQFNPYRRDPHV